MSRVMASQPESRGGPSAMRGVGGKAGQASAAGGGGGGGGSGAGAAPALVPSSPSTLPPWSQEQPSAEELTLYTTLSAYADALDALPLDLTRSFSDLRELDAVLGPHLNSLTVRLNQLTAVIEDEGFSPGERLLALKEVAEEARAYKMGGEDKIRVALNTAETIISHTTYIDTLLNNLASVPSLARILSPPTHSHLAGHLSDGTALAPGSGPGGNNPANIEAPTEAPSPAKKKKPGQAAQAGPPAALTAAEKRANEAQASQQASGSAAAKKRKPGPQTSGKARTGAAAANEEGEVIIKRQTVKRAKANGASNAAGAGATGAGRDDEDRDGGGSETATLSQSRSRGGRGGGGRAANVRGSGSDNEEDMSDSGSAAPRPARVARAPRPADEAASNAAPALGDDADERRYCFCNNVSYGDMIGCDGDDCEREWFHLGCVGLLKPPQGTWYCDDCAQKRASRNKKAKTTKLAKTSGAHGGGVVETKARTASAKR